MKKVLIFFVLILPNTYVVAQDLDSVFADYGVRNIDFTIGTEITDLVEGYLSISIEKKISSHISVGGAYGKRVFNGYNTFLLYDYWYETFKPFIDHNDGYCLNLFMRYYFDIYYDKSYFEVRSRYKNVKMNSGQNQRYYATTFSYGYKFKHRNFSISPQLEFGNFNSGIFILGGNFPDMYFGISAIAAYDL